jgi:beta-fructofuranosidase
MVLDAPDGYRVVMAPQPAQETFYLRARLDIAPDTTETGLLLRASDDGDEGYVVRLEPKRNRMTFDRWPRTLTGPMQWQISGDVPFEIERPCALDPGEHTLEVLVDADLVVAVIDRQVALSARMYDRSAGHLGLFVGEGRICIRGLSVHVRATPHSTPLLPSQAGEASIATRRVPQ